MKVTSHHKIFSDNGKVDNSLKLINELISKKSSFRVKRTKSTVTIDTVDRVYIFSESGESDPMKLALINRVRASAKKKKGSWEKIDWFGLTNLSIVPKEKYKIFDCAKIDLKSAYWTTAYKLGIIDETTYKQLEYWLKTNIEMLNEKHPNYSEMRKKIISKYKGYRLSILGSLASVKKIETYANGELQKIVDANGFETTCLIQKEPTRDLYFSVCEYVDNEMKRLAEHFSDSVIYYYVDCLFVIKNEKKIAEYIKENTMYDVSLEVGKASINSIGNYVFLEYMDENFKDIKYPICSKEY